MHYLITGGAGFIGSHLADHLLAQGHHVHAFDNLSTGSLDIIAHLADHDRFTLTVGDVCDKSALEAAADGCDRIVHLAAAVGVKRILEHPVETITTNVRGTEHVLEIAAARSVPTLIASTSEVYGKAMETVEGLDALAEDGPWMLGATSKRCLEPLQSVGGRMPAPKRWMSSSRWPMPTSVDFPLWRRASLTP